MKEQAEKGQQRSLSSAAQLVSLCADISPSSSHFFEVLYVGKIRINNRKIPESFIDDALDKFRIHEQNKQENANSSNNVSPQISNASSIDILRRGSADSTVSHDGSEVGNTATTPAENDQNNTTPTKHPDEHNRTMVLQVGRNDLRLISPDRKLILLHKQHRDIASCVQGLREPEHFGFICRENHPATTPSSTATTPVSSATSANSYLGKKLFCTFLFSLNSKTYHKP